MFSKIIKNADLVVPKFTLSIMSGSWLVSLIAHENEIRVIGLFISLIAGALLVIMNIPKAIKAWFVRESGRKYDYLAWLGFLFRRERGSDSKWFCSEAIADCLGYRDAWRFDPNTLFVVLRRANDFNNKKVGE